jgi:DNA primase
MTSPVEPSRLVAAHRAARAFYREQLLDSYGPRRYLVERGLGPLIGRAEPWWLGYAPGWTCLVDHLTRQGFTPDELLAGGLAVPGRRGGIVDAFRDRVMFPIHDSAGDPIAFIGRAAPGAKAPKYFNTRQTLIYRKGELLYGLREQAGRLAAAWTPVIVEGPIDVLAVYLAHADDARFGCAAVSACGTALSHGHVAQVATLPGARGRGVVVAYDNDGGGHAAMDRAWRLLPRSLDLRTAGLPPDRDPADFLVHADGLDELRDALGGNSRPLTEAVIDMRLDRLLARRPDALSHVEGQLGTVRQLVGLLIGLPPEQVVALTGHIARRTGADIELVADAVLDHLEQARYARATPEPSKPVLAGPEPGSQSREGRYGRASAPGNTRHPRRR